MSSPWDILNGGADSLRTAWNATEAAGDFAPLPAGKYVAHIISGELITASTGTPGYKLAFRVLDGEHAGRLFWHDLWLTPAALPMSKRDLGKLGVTSLEQLEAPLPPGIRCACTIVLREDDNGSKYNRVKSFDVLAVDDDPTADPDFAPVEPTDPKSPPPLTVQATLLDVSPERKAGYPND